LDLAHHVLEQGLEVQRLMEVVRQELKIQNLLVEVVGLGPDDGVDDLREHVLAQSALSILPSTHQLRVEPGVTVSPLGAIQSARPEDPEEPDADGADRLEHDVRFFPLVRPRRPPVLDRAHGSALTIRYAPSTLATSMSYVVGSG